MVGFPLPCLITGGTSFIFELKNKKCIDDDEWGIRFFFKSWWVVITRNTRNISFPSHNGQL